MLDATVSTTQLEVVACYYDVPSRTKDDNSAYLHAMALTTTNNSTLITVVPAPPQGIARVIDYITLYNADVTTRVVYWKIDDAGVRKITQQASLQTGQASCYESDTGWYIK